MTGLMFQDRSHAGRNLAAIIARQKLSNPVVIALPRGAVPVAIEVAAALDAPVDTLMVRKLRAPADRRVSIGAIAADGSTVFNDDLVPDLAGVEGPELDQLLSGVHATLGDLSARYRDKHEPLSLRNRDVLVVADGMTSGGSMYAAVNLLRRQSPTRIVVAVPTTSKYAEQRLLEVADDVICLDMPDAFLAVGCYYLNFEQVSHDDACRQLADYRRASDFRANALDASTAVIP